MAEPCKKCGHPVRGSRSLPASAFELCGDYRRALNVSHRNKRYQALRLGQELDEQRSAPNLLNIGYMDEARVAARQSRIKSDLRSIANLFLHNGYSRDEIVNALGSVMGEMLGYSDIRLMDHDRQFLNDLRKALGPLTHAFP